VVRPVQAGGEGPGGRLAALALAGRVFVGVDAQDFSGDARKFGKHYEITYPLVHDGSGKVVGDYGVVGFPETFFVDRNGHIVGDHVDGPVSNELLDRNIRLALRS